MSRSLKNPFRTSIAIRSISASSRFPQAKTFNEVAQDAANLKTNEPIIFKDHFCDVPAISKWFIPSQTETGYHELNFPYLSNCGSTVVPLELTRFDATGKRTVSFERFEAPLSLLLSHMISSDTSLALYLAQCSLNDLPSQVQTDIPTPALINRLGRGDIYGSSLWMGRPPTRTPLHRDPNPNLFVQLAGRKVIRLMRPKQGTRLYERSRVGQGHANMRGDEMMAGQEMERLESVVWGEDSSDNESVGGVEATLDSGQALFIPRGWWHAVRGVGKGANASANWWFR